MSDLISRADAMDVIKSLQIILGGISVFSQNIKDSVLDCLDMLPAVDAEPVRRGRWVDGENGTVCSCCKGYLPCAEFTDPEDGDIFVEIHMTPHCPNCGAHMDLEMYE